MKKKGVIIGVIIAVIVIIAVSIIGSYNGLISLEESANTAYAVYRFNFKDVWILYRTLLIL